MAYTVALPDGRTIEFPDNVPQDKAAAIIQQQFPEFAPKTSAVGQAKEFLKGIPAGAVGLLESAATGASALLPEDAEKSAREGIKRVATAAKAPFTAAPGYEEAISRKFGEAVGSTVPFFAAGPLGIAGRAGATALGVGAGAGEARVRAEEGKAEGADRGTATMLGAAVGATEMLPVFKFVEQLGKPLKDGITSQIRRALATGGAEAAQEVTSQIAQNLIAKGLYKPDQALIEGAGEAAAYGGATGALIQGLTDMALGRRARAGAPAPTVPPEVEPPAQEAIPPAPMPLPERRYGELATEIARISSLADTKSATPEEMQALKAMRGELTRRGAAEIESQRAAATAGVEGPAQFPSLAGAGPQQMEMREATTEGELPPETDLFGAPLLPKAVQPESLADLIGAELPATTEMLDAAGLAPTQQELEAAGQQRLPLRRTPEGQPTTATPSPAPIEPMTLAPGAITTAEIRQFGVMSKANRQWLMDNVFGKTPDEVRAMVEANPAILTQVPGVAKSLQEIIANASPKEIPSGPITPTPTAEVAPANQPAKPRGRKPSVGVPSEPAGTVAVQPGAGVTPAAEQPATPDERGLVPPEQPAAAGATPAGDSAPALTIETAAPAKPAAPTGMFGQLVAPGAPDILEAEATTAPKQAAPSVWDTRGPSTIGEALATTEDEADAAKAAKRGKVKVPPPSTAITTALPDQEAVKATEARPATKRTPRKSAGAAGPRTELETTDAINGKNLLEVAEWGASNFTDPDFRVIARRVADTLGVLQRAGLKVGKLTVTDPGKRMRGGARGTTTMRPPRSGATASEVSIMLNHPDNGAESGTADKAVLHELLHAATMGATRIGKLKSAKGTKVGKIVTDLYAVSKAVFEHVDAKANRGETLTETEQRLRTNYMRDVDEVIAWTLTDRDMQAYMETVPYKSTNAWGKFVTLIRDMLNLTPKADTALSEILRVSGELTALTEADLAATTKATGKQFALSASTEALIAGSGAVDPVEVTALTRMVNVVKAIPGVSYTTRFRTQVADIAATVESRLTAQFDGKVRDSLGNINPMGLYRQAQDYTKMLLEFFQAGSLVKNAATGQWEVSAAKGVRPPADVYKLIKDWGDANGWTREDATQKASRILEAVRLDGLRTANRTQGATFTLHKINEASTLTVDQQIDALLADYKADPALREMNTLMDESRKAMIDHLVDVGRLTVNQGADWKDVAGYVPFDRLSEDSLEKFSKVKRISGKGLAQLGKLPELKGTTRLAVGNVFNNYIDTMGWLVGQVVKTDATVQTLRSLEKVTAAKFLGPSHQNQPHTVGAYVNGVMNYWSLPSKYDVMAFKDLNPPKAGWLLQLGAFSNVLRKSITVLPPFALKQVTDDVQRAIFTSGVSNPGALLRMALTNFPKLALAELRGIQHPMVRDFGALGLTGEYDFQSNQPASSLLKDIGVVKRGKWESLLHRLDGITRASDLAIRKAIYDQTLKEGGEQLLAQTRAREFINFRRRGASDFVGAMVTTIPFFNAYVQGMDVLYRSASGKDSSSSVGRAQARRMFWSRMGIAASLSALYALGKDDDDERYKNMDLRTRDSNWIVGDYKLPVPGELGAIFKVMPERVVEYMRRQGTPQEQEAFEAVRTTLTYMYEQYAGRMTPVPQAIKPVMEAWANKSFLTGRPLEGFHQQVMDLSERVTAQTSELALAIAGFSRDTVGVEVSPIMIDNALRGYFGSTAALLTATTDSLLNPTRVDRPLHKWALLSTYMYDPVGTRTMTEFYEERERMGKANATLNRLMTTDIDKAAAYAEAHQDELVFESAINSTLEQLQRTRAYRTFLNSPDGAKEMPADEREAALKEIKQYETEMVSWVRDAKADYAKSKP